VPAALIGADVRAFLAGAAAMDVLTRRPSPLRNPAALLAAAWHVLGGGRGDRAMVLLPYRDRLALLPRYVQQLVMESLGKRLDRAGRVVCQGLTVYGHKGATDQHSYVQQLLEGRDDAFVTFIAVDTERDGDPVPLEGGVTLGDRLFANLVATRNALSGQCRGSITITIRDAGPFSLGLLVALFERAVGLYGELVDVNAYHQPAVDKHAGVDVLEIQLCATAHLRAAQGSWTADEVADAIGAPAEVSTVYEILRRLSTDGTRGITATPAGAPGQERFAVTPLALTGKGAT
jgi:glucose-6-phosphate isomerase